MADILSKRTTVATAAVDILRQKRLTVATAESCTGGLLSAAITAVSGASAVFGCGVAAYAPEIKHDVLGVPADILEQHGTVSSQTAAAMADGVRRMSGASIGVSITGVAGPEPSEGKPIGTVYIALANEERVWLQQLQPCDTLTDRESIRSAAVDTALSMIENYAQAYPVMVAGSLPLTPPQPVEIVIPVAPTTNMRRRFLATVLPWKGDSRQERLLKIGAILLACALLVCAVFGINRLISETGNRSLYSDLQSMYTDEQTITADNSDMLPRFASLYLQNADIGGWIRIDGTSISYPVMKNAGSDYYADHNFRQQASAYGVPYFDSHNSVISPDEKNKVLIVYGNNTGDGQMFSELTAYRDADFFKEHAVVDMSTLYTSDHWQLFGVMVLDPEEINAFQYTKTTFENEEAFLQHIADIRKRSLVNTNVEVGTDDELLLLVTQVEEEYGFDNATLVVVGRRITDGEALTDTESMEISRNSTVLMPRAWVRKKQNVSTKRTTATTTETKQQTTGLTSSTNASTANTDGEVTTTQTVTPSQTESTDSTTATTATVTTTVPTATLTETPPSKTKVTTGTTSPTGQDVLEEKESMLVNE